MVQLNANSWMCERFSIAPASVCLRNKIPSIGWCVNRSLFLISWKTSKSKVKVMEPSKDLCAAHSMAEGEGLTEGEREGGEVGGRRERRGQASMGPRQTP